MGVYTIEEIAEKVRPIAERYNLGKVYLFGSYARGEATEDSDIDLLVDAEKIKGLFALGGLYGDLEEAFGKKIDLVTLRQLEESRSSPLNKRFVEEVELDKTELFGKVSLQAPKQKVCRGDRGRPVIAREERDINILAQILENCKDIEKCLSELGNSFEDFAADGIQRDAAAMCVLRTGGLSERLSNDFKERHSEIQWDKIDGMTDIFTGDIPELDVEKVWLAVTSDIPALKAFCERQIKLFEQEQG